MTEQIDYTAEAKANLAVVGDVIKETARVSLSETVAISQVQATLALVEQQRIANIIALAALPALDGFENDVYDARLEALMGGLLDREEAPAVPGYGPAGLDEHTFIRDDIKKGLGL